MVGTLYGTLEVACAIVSEMARCASVDFATTHARRIRRWTLLWCVIGAYALLGWLSVYQATGAAGKPRLLLAILTPANLFTGVLGCGLFCLLNLWMDRRFLPRPLRLPTWLWLLNLIAALVFIFVGIKGYWDDASRWYAIGTLVGLLLLGIALGYLLDGRTRFRDSGDTKCDA